MKAIEQGGPVRIIAPGRWHGHIGVVEEISLDENPLLKIRITPGVRITGAMEDVEPVYLAYDRIKERS